MPKKRSSVYSKPSSPAHPALSSSSKTVSHSLTAAASSGNSVNDRIQQLRLEQKPTGTKPFEAPPSHTVHPSLRGILQVPDVPPPRPRPGLRVTGGRRGPAGPRAPDSWLKTRATQQRKNENAVPTSREIPALPGHDLPGPGSLLDLALKNLARDWDFHIQYDQYYLATVPARYKELLLRYVALYFPHGMDRAGLETLFLDESELEGATGAEGLKRLDLSTSAGRSISVKELRNFFTAPPLSLPQPTSTETLSPEVVPESWDIPPTNPSLPRFHNITHLSLSQPPPSISWSHLLSHLLPHAGPPLTHLSLAFWPLPTLTPNSLTASTATPSGSVQAGGSHFYSAYDNDWSEASSILRRVARSTLCLQWLDLTGDWPWTQALACEGFDWGQLWGGLETVVVGQGWMPEWFRGSENEWKITSESFGHGLGSVIEVSSRKMEAERRRVVEWAVCEAEGLELERKVRARISDAIPRAEESGSAGLEREGNRSDGSEGDDWSSPGPFRRSKTPKVAARTRMVRFERDWDAAWIKDALMEIWERERQGNGVVPARLERAG